VDAARGRHRHTLDRHQGASTALLTAVLILVTIYYAFQNRAMVKEMKHARDAALLPKLALDFHRLAPTAMTAAIKNVGPGAAVDIDVRLVWDAIGGGPAPERRWRRSILSPGEQTDFFFTRRCTERQPEHHPRDLLPNSFAVQDGRRSRKRALSR
jgi:hypothetical protein